MENPQPIAIESFSYRWLIDNQPPSSNDLISIFQKTSKEYEDNFKFDISMTPPSNHLIHADEIFSDGQIKPVYIATKTALKASTSVPSSPVSFYASRSPFVAEKKRYYILEKILKKCIRFVKPLCRKASRKRSRVDDLERKVFELHSFNNSLEATPRASSAYSLVEFSDLEKMSKNFDVVKNWRTSPNIIISPSRLSSNVCCDAENSIHEAILYCKRSIGK